MAGVLALMILTSTGIFSYLSAGYQADVLPLKQMNEQVRLLEEERTRAIERKKQIDEQLMKGPSVSNVTSGNRIDPNAARTIREARKTLESTGKQYKEEQQALQARVAELDRQLLSLKQELVKTEAHIGPITYVAKAFDLEVDNATKYLIFLIIFAFDPMAVALTLAVNIVLRLRNEEASLKRQHVVDNIEKEYFPTDPQPLEEPVAVTPPPTPTEPQEEPIPTVEPPVEPTPVPEPPVEPLPAREPAPSIPPAQAPPHRRHTRPYGGNWSQDNVQTRIGELVGHYKYLIQKQQSGEELTPDDKWELSAIHDILQKHGFLHYLS
jgi:hypothetical protein